jgi:hypothetical protein
LILVIALAANQIPEDADYKNAIRERNESNKSSGSKAIALGDSSHHDEDEDLL